MSGLSRASSLCWNSCISHQVCPPTSATMKSKLSAGFALYAHAVRQPGLAWKSRAMGDPELVSKVTRTWQSSPVHHCNP